MLMAALVGQSERYRDSNTSISDLFSSGTRSLLGGRAFSTCRRRTVRIALFGGALYLDGDVNSYASMLPQRNSLNPETIPCSRISNGIGKRKETNWQGMKNVLKNSLPTVVGRSPERWPMMLLKAHTMNIANMKWKTRLGFCPGLADPPAGTAVVVALVVG